MRVSDLQSLLSVRAILIRFRKGLFCLSISRLAWGYYIVVILLQYPGTSQIHKTFRCQWLLINSQVLPRASGRVADSSGSEYTELLTRWQPRYVSQIISTSYLVLGHQSFDRNLPFILTIPGCPWRASARTRSPSLLGSTILVPRRIIFPITQSTLLTGMFWLHW